MFIVPNVFNYNSKYDKIWNSFVVNRQRNNGEICYIPSDKPLKDYMIIKYEPEPFHGLTII